jgi:2-amino-4-hydroxy-6-hydroxymethyldihydropteridine diphosphokinase / dihydropteroate synthase
MLDNSLSLRVHKISPIYHSPALLPDDAPTTWDQPFLNLNILCETNLTPLQLLDLIKTIELKLGRTLRGRWAPREIDIDILAMDSLVYETDLLKIPHPGLIHRPFALLPLSDLVPNWKFPIPGLYFGKTASELAYIYKSSQSDHHTCNAKRTSECLTELMGIINLTPDSFSDGGLFLSADAAIKQAQYYISHGIKIIDLGAESTRPGAPFVSPEVEWKRLEPVLKTLISMCHNSPDIRISVDTRHPQTASQAVQCGAHWVNDVNGFENELMGRAVVDSNTDLVVMHSLSVPPKRDLILPSHRDPISQLLEWGEKKLTQLEAAGINSNRIILDPGIGFGKTSDQSWEILQSLSRLKGLGTRILVGHSRKSFLGSVTHLSPENRDPETVAVSMSIIQKGIDFLRVHNTELHQRYINAWTRSDGVYQWGS